MESVYDVVSDKIWRKKNILFVNIPESTKKSIEDKKDDDLDEVDRILNMLIPFDQSMIECKPVRVGKIGPKPRLLRLTFKSEYVVRQITDLARDNNDIINPDEQDKTKKIYINKDFSVDDRMKRKRMIEEKKELERQGIHCDIKRNRLVRRDVGSDYQSHPPRNDQGQSSRPEPRGNDQQRPLDNARRQNDSFYNERSHDSNDSHRSNRTDPGQQNLYSDRLKSRPQSDIVHNRHQSRYPTQRKYNQRPGQDYRRGPDSDRMGRSPLNRDELPLNRGHFRPENEYGRSPLVRDSLMETDRQSRMDRDIGELEGAVGGIGTHRPREYSRDRNQYFTPRVNNTRNNYNHRHDSRHMGNRSHTSRPRSNSRRRGSDDDFGIFD